METVKAISLSVKPVKAELDSVKSTKAKTMTVKWKQDKKATGYYISYSTDKNFKKNVINYMVSKGTDTSTKITGLTSGKTYYVHVCAEDSGLKGDYSDVKKVKIK